MVSVMNGVFGRVCALYNFAILFCVSFAIMEHDDIVAEYEFSESVQLSQIAVDDTTGDVYVAGTNFVSHFFSNLTQKKTHSIGPLNDTTNCDQEMSPKAILRNNVITVLEISEFNKKLLVCGSLNHGRCSLHDLHDITRANRMQPGETGGCGSVVTKFFSNDSNELIMGISQPQPIDIPLISFRKIMSSNKYPELAYGSDISVAYAKLDIIAEFRKHVKIKFIKVLQYNNGLYFITVKAKNVSDESNETMLFRVCADTKSVYPFLAIPLTCKSTDTRFTIATTGSVLNGDTLVVAFSRSTADAPDKPDRKHISAICAYPFHKIEEELRFIQSECDNSEETVDSEFSVPDWIMGPYEKCNTRTNAACKNSMNLNLCSNKSTNVTMCQSGRHIAVEGRNEEALDVTSIAIVDGMVTSITTYVNNNNKYVMVTNHLGLLKIYKYGKVESKTSLQVVVNISIGTAGAELDTEFDQNQQNVYLLVNNKVLKYSIDHCNKYKECYRCADVNVYGCIWYNDQCVAARIVTDTKLTHTCTPVIINVKPTRGKTGGGTRLTITGLALGSKKSTQRDVEVCGHPCILDNKTSNNTHIFCATPAAIKTEEFCYVSVTIVDVSRAEAPSIIRGYTTSKKQVFQYKDVMISNFSPTLGPESGGTIIAIIGVNFDIVSNISVNIGDISSCDVYNRTLDKIQCKTSRLNTRLPLNRSEGKELACSQIRMTIDDALIISHGNYCYWEDPEITSVTPRRSIKSGGIRVKVTGTNFNVIANPRIGLTLEDSIKQPTPEKCKRQNSTSMICPTPKIDDIIPVNGKVSGNIYFEMDGVDKLRNLSHYNSNLSRTTVNPDPTFSKYPTTQKWKSLTREIKIHSTGIKRAVSPEDISISIGNLTCPVERVEESQVICSIRTTNSSNQTHYVVTVKVGNLEFIVGRIEISTNYEQRTVENNTDKLISYAVVIGSIVAIFVVIILVICYCLFRRSSGEKSGASFHELSESTGDSHMTISGVQLVKKVMDANTILDIDRAHLFINRNNLTIGEIIGAGNFGCVYDGYIIENDEKTQVAVKTLQDDDACEINLKDFVEEALIMKDFDNPNVLQLIGISLSKNSSPLVVLPYMGNGDLLKFVANEENEITMNQVLRFGTDISRGMEYLASLKFVHRDLAARNCMLDTNFNVKVADFGLTREIYEKGYYHSDNKKKLPIRWMAIECIERGTYSSKSDVWSLAVVLWELLTRGMIPYPGVDGWNVIRYLRCQHRLFKPWFCDDNLYNVMLKCWETEPSDRPDFTEITKDLCNIGETYVHEEVGPPHDTVDGVKSALDSVRDSNAENTDNKATHSQITVVSIPQCYNCQPHSPNLENQQYFVLETK